MTVLQAALVLLTAVGGTLVVFSRDPLRQAIVAGVYGLILAALFFAFQAPDVGLSQIVVGGVAVPMLLVLTLSKLRRDQREREAREREDPR